MRVLISLVGEQPTPNLIPLFAARPEERAQCVHLLVSNQTHIQEVGQQLCAAIRGEELLAGVSVVLGDEEPLDAWDLARARQQCRTLIADYQAQGADVTVNLTGGTKIMSLAAYQAAMDQYVPMIYVNTEDVQVMRFDGCGQRLAPERFRVRIPIETQLRAAGRELDKARTGGVEAIPPEQRLLLKWSVDHYGAAIEAGLIKVVKAVYDLGSRHKQSASDKTPPRPFTVPFTPGSPAVRAALQRWHEAGVWQWSGAELTISAESWPLINGLWLERYAVTALAEGVTGGWFDQVLGPVYVRQWPEIDAMVSCNGQLAMVECKLTGGKSEDGSLTDHLSKLHSHEHLLGGVYGHSVFVRAANSERGDLLKWAQEYRAGMVMGADLPNLAKLVFKRFRL